RWTWPGRSRGWRRDSSGHSVMDGRRWPAPVAGHRMANLWSRQPRGVRTTAAAECVDTDLPRLAGGTGYSPNAGAQDTTRLRAPRRVRCWRGAARERRFSAGAVAPTRADAPARASARGTRTRV